MTAPYPGLTDLIAAEVGTHVVETVTAIDQLPWSERQGRDGYLLDCRCGAEVNCPQAEFNAAPVDSTSGALAYMIREHVAAHVALVVEQHTNGRITEPETTSEGGKRWYVNGYASVEFDAACDIWLNEVDPYVGDSGHARKLAAALHAAATAADDLRAALEGEQQ
ncbi:hypothetical protein [Rhodococcus sp. JT-3]|uniref:hypothetical protein n=1 Tax=Rhodococcus sp. JT-3 TaxID=1973213 RepID=UPI0013036DA4|nr:hypothetical protein [Rhodococcus sp. JT-3]